MGRAKIAITLDPGVVDELDRLVDSRMFPNRSLAIEEAVKEKLHLLSRSRLARGDVRVLALRLRNPSTAPRTGNAAHAPAGRGRTLEAAPPTP